MSYKRKKVSKAINVMLISLIVLLILGLSYFFFTKYEISSRGSQSTKMSKANACKDNGETSADQFLDDYVVMHGDSLLLIAERQLGSRARVNELAMFNLTRYPGFYSGTPGVPNLAPFLEIGWVLKVPPKWMPATSGNLVTLRGQIVDGVAGYDFGISRTSGEDGRYSYFNLDKDAVNQNGTIFKISDCVTLLRDNVTVKTIKIDLQ